MEKNTFQAEPGLNMREIFQKCLDYSLSEYWIDLWEEYFVGKTWWSERVVGSDRCRAVYCFIRVSSGIWVLLPAWIKKNTHLVWVLWARSLFTVSCCGQLLLCCVSLWNRCVDRQCNYLTSNTWLRNLQFELSDIISFLAYLPWHLPEYEVSQAGLNCDLACSKWEGSKRPWRWW